MGDRTWRTPSSWERCVGPRNPSSSSAPSSSSLSSLPLTLPLMTSSLTPTARASHLCACVHACMCACVHVCMCACVHVCMWAPAATAPGAPVTTTAPAGRSRVATQRMAESTLPVLGRPMIALTRLSSVSDWLAAASAPRCMHVRMHARADACVQACMRASMRACAHVHASCMHGRVWATCACPCMHMLHMHMHGSALGRRLHAAFACCVCMLHVHAACARCMCMLYEHAA